MPSFVSPAATYRSAGALETSSIVDTSGLTIVANNLLIAMVFADAFNSPVPTSVTITPPTGWNPIDTQSHSDGVNRYFQAGIYNKVATAGDVGAASYTWTFSVSTSTGVNASIVLLQYSGTATSNPIVAHSITAIAIETSVATNTISTTSITDLVLDWYAAWTSSAGWTITGPGAPTTERENLGPLSVFDVDAAMQLGDEPGPNPAGTTTARTATAASALYMMAASIAIAAAAQGGYRRIYLPQYQHRQRHQFTNPRHVRIYHPKPAQYETLLVPVKPKPFQPRLRKVHWQFAEGWRRRVVYNWGRGWHLPVQFETLLVPVKPRPVPFRTRAHWKLPDAWRKRMIFKGRLWHWPQEFMTLLAPVKPRPIPFHTRIHWKLPSINDARLNVLKRLKRGTPFDISKFFIGLPKFRTRAHWKLPAMRGNQFNILKRLKRPDAFNIIVFFFSQPKFRTRRHWLLPEGWRERLKFPVKYRPAEFMTLLVPVKPRPFSPRLRARWRLPVLHNMRRLFLHREWPAQALFATLKGAFKPRLRPRWLFPEGWRARDLFKLKYRLAQYETALVPVRPRPVPFKTRIHFKLPALRDIHWNPLRRPRASAFDPATVNIGAPRHYRPRWQRRLFRMRPRIKRWPAQFETTLVPVKPRPVPFRTRIRWRLPALRDIKWNPLRRPRASAFDLSSVNVGASRRYRARRAIQQVRRRRLAHRLGMQILSTGIVRQYRPRRLIHQTRARRLSRRLGAQILSAAFIRHYRARFQARRQSVHRQAHRPSAFNLLTLWPLLVRHYRPHRMIHQIRARRLARRLGVPVLSAAFIHHYRPLHRMQGWRARIHLPRHLGASSQILAGLRRRQQVHATHSPGWYRRLWRWGRGLFVPPPPPSYLPRLIFRATLEATIRFDARLDPTIHFSATLESTTIFPARML